MLRGEFIEGSFHSHQVPLPNAKTSQEELSMLQKWLSSYKPHELFHMNSGSPVDAVLSVVPQQDNLKLGQRKEAYASYESLHVPEWIGKGVNKGTQESCMKLVGSFLKEVVKESVFILFMLVNTLS